jgi:hypothetical protein
MEQENMDGKKKNRLIKEEKKRSEKEFEHKG